MNNQVQVHEDDVREIVARLSGQPAQHIRLDDDFAETLGLDSIDRLDLLVEIEQRLGVHVDDEQLENFGNLKDLLAVLDIQPAEYSS